jgi:hypothetical protein
VPSAAAAVIPVVSTAPAISLRVGVFAVAVAFSRDRPTRQRRHVTEHIVACCIENNTQY